MDGHCRRCGSVAYNVVGAYCPHCASRLFTRPAVARTPPPSPARQVLTTPTVSMASDQTAPDLHRKQEDHNDKHIMERYLRSPPPPFQNQIRPSDYSTSLDTIDSSDEERQNNATRQNNQLDADLNTAMQDHKTPVDRPPIHKPRVARSRSPARVSNQDQDVARFRDRDQARPSTPRRPSAIQGSPQRWCLWCHFAGHFAYHDCRTKATPPPETIKLLNSHWGEYYCSPRTKDVRSPTNLLHIRDIAHQLIAHCNKVETWVKRRDTFFTTVMQDLRSYAAYYQAWKYCMAEANTATNEYLLAIQGFAGELYNSKELIHRPLLQLATLERRKFGLSDSDLTVMESDDRRLSRFLHSLRNDTHKIQLDRDEYDAMLMRFNSIRTKYLSRWQEVTEFQTELVSQVAQKSPEVQQSRKIKEAFSCLQAANPVPRKTRLACISVEDVFLPDIATIWQQWDLLSRNDSIS